ncbi:MAG: hypothetical protein EBR02_10360, partial [Alphaproteobacteria bacterium]|nr:hypothetical protein [Alphaproteobacteria bacterium]
MQAFAQHLARDLALPALSSGYKNLVATLRENAALADAARSQGLDALLASDNSALAELKKGNKELVTSAEKIAEKAMADAVREKFPAHAIVGEEHGFQAGSDARWVFDPVDGTSAMIRTAMCEAFGLPLPQPTPAFGITIALVEGAVPTLGLVAELAPKDGGLAISHLYIGDGKTATCDGKLLPLPPYPKTLTGAKLACTVPEIMFGANAKKWGGFQGLLDATGQPCITDQNCIGFMRLL